MYQCGHAWHQDPCVLISVQGLDIVSDGPAPIGFSSLEGWTGGTAATGGPVPWEAADGGIQGDIHFGPRTITIEGDITAPDHREYTALAEEIGAVLTRPRSGILVVDETYHLGLVRQVEVVRTRPPLISPVGDRHGVFTLTLEAASHLRVDVDERSAVITAAGAGLENIGTADVPVVAHLVGPLSNPGLSWPGGAWAYSGSIPAGTTITVDMGTRVVRDPATTEHSRHRAAGKWLALPPGTTMVTRTGSGSGTVTAYWRSAWH